MRVVTRVIDIDDNPNFQRNVTRFLNSIPNEDFLQSFQDFYNRSQDGLIMEGDYFVGDYERPPDSEALTSSIQREENLCESMDYTPTYELNLFAVDSRAIARHSINTRTQSRESMECEMMFE
ncbi:hypothetical protein TNCV_2117941 [Trichonephila clavipes]|nr:hypothetical protein TNCV_2117941 [Trichonephila clavipes]